MNYLEKLHNAIAGTQSCLCIGLDPHLDLFPRLLTEKIPDKHRRVTYFLKEIIETTQPYCAAYKPNIAFFEALGDRGFEVFRQVIEAIPDDKVIIADIKRGDIGSTAQQYRRAFFDIYNVDAVTLNPLMGFETLVPYFGYPDKSAYVLTLTSNEGAADFLEKPFSGFNSMAESIAANLQELQGQSEASLGMVVGATKSDDLSRILQLNPGAPLLIPGIGRQGGSVEELTTVLENHTGLPLVSSSRSILFAGGKGEHWKQAAEDRAARYREQLTPITQAHV
ncbi:MAG: orotidine-5'-phosphate decarboxylase [Balneolaceae bacterium]|nr:orotidine-5'-phosphate decarboxylase [Balneolaceae bacterium]